MTMIGRYSSVGGKIDFVQGRRRGSVLYKSMKLKKNLKWTYLKRCITKYYECKRKLPFFQVVFGSRFFLSQSQDPKICILRTIFLAGFILSLSLLSLYFNSSIFEIFSFFPTIMNIENIMKCYIVIVASEWVLLTIWSPPAASGSSNGVWVPVHRGPDPEPTLTKKKLGFRTGLKEQIQILIRPDRIYSTIFLSFSHFRAKSLNIQIILTVIHFGFQ